MSAPPSPGHPQAPLPGPPFSGSLPVLAVRAMLIVSLAAPLIGARSYRFFKELIFMVFFTNKSVSIVYKNRNGAGVES